MKLIKRCLEFAKKFLHDLNMFQIFYNFPIVLKVSKITFKTFFYNFNNLITKNKALMFTPEYGSLLFQSHCRHLIFCPIFNYLNYINYKYILKTFIYLRSIFGKCTGIFKTLSSIKFYSIYIVILLFQIRSILNLMHQIIILYCIMNN